MAEETKYPKVTEVRNLPGGLPYLVKFESKLAAEAMYDHTRHNLIITYSNGSRYSYSKFPIDVWIMFLKSGSKGSFISKHIKGKFEYERIDREDKGS